MLASARCGSLWLANETYENNGKQTDTNRCKFLNVEGKFGKNCIVKYINGDTFFLIKVY